MGDDVEILLVEDNPADGKSDPLLKAVLVIVMTSSNDEKGPDPDLQARSEQLYPEPVDFNQFRDIAKQLGLYWLLVNVPPSAGAFARLELNRTR